MSDKRILIVDDHPVNRKLPAMLLRGSGWECNEVSGGAEALLALHKGSYMAVLLDISMPGMSGDEVCRRIRADEKLRHLHIVAYTAHANEDARITILGAGFDGLLTKPISKQALLDALAPAEKKEGAQ